MTAAAQPLRAMTHEELAARIESVDHHVDQVEEQLERHDHRLSAVEAVVEASGRDVRVVRRLATAAIGASLMSADPESLTGHALELAMALFGL